VNSAKAVSTAVRKIIDGHPELVADLDGKTGSVSFVFTDPDSIPAFARASLALGQGNHEQRV
jgi:hypothetical protein